MMKAKNNMELITSYTFTIMEMMATESDEEEDKLFAIARKLEKEILRRMGEKEEFLRMMR